MPAKIKWLWVFCCLIAFFGFIFLSIKAEIKMAQINSKQKNLEQVKAPVPVPKTIQEKEFNVSRKVKDIPEFIALGKYKEAANIAQQVIEKDPENAKAYTWWGISLVKMKRLDEAIKKFLKSSQIDSTQPRTFLYWGLTLSMKTKYEEAIEKYKTAVQLNPENSNAYAYWGGALASLKDYREAAIKLQKSLDINPFNQMAYGVLVDILYYTDEYKKAWKTVFKARKLNLTISEKTLKRLESAMPEPSL